MRSVLIRNTLHKNLDLVGAFLSLACAIHCIAIPILVVILPLAGLSFFLSQTVEKIFVIASITLAAFNLCWGYTIHREVRVLLMFVAAAAMLISGIFILPHEHHFAHESHIHVNVSHAGEVQSTPEKHTFHHPKGIRETRPQDNPLGLFLLVTGGTAIAISHLLNRHFCKSCKICKTHLRSYG